jgi:hypothetical protein
MDLLDTPEMQSAGVLRDPADGLGNGINLAWACIVTLEPDISVLTAVC